MHRLHATLLASGLVLALAACASTTASSTNTATPAAAHADAGLQAAIAGPWRSEGNRARDRYRHPAETLAFFGVKPTDTVIEISPGAGWYSEILAPYLHDRGRFIAASAASPGRANPLDARFLADPARFGRADLHEYNPKDPAFGAADSADVVLTFRNLHNWLAAGTAEYHLRAAYDVLKPGGVLGVVEHRAKPGTDIEASKKSGYVAEQLVIDLAGEVGFELDARSEVNANPRDTADHPNGVWTLPPTNRHDAADKAKYQAIGESDRMTLRFRKPAR
jgi:predicted methyltransferase